MHLTLLEKSLINNARMHQEALSAFYPKHLVGEYSDEDHTEYLKHSGALTELVSLAHYKSGLSSEAAEQLHAINFKDIDAQMRPYRDLGRATLPPALSTAIVSLKVRDKLLQDLGAIERADSVEQAEDVSSRATTNALTARDYDRDLSIADWHALDSHIRERIASKRVS